MYVLCAGWFSAAAAGHLFSQRAKTSNTTSLSDSFKPDKIPTDTIDPHAAPELSKELVLKHAVQGTIIVAFTNHKHIDYTFNWVNYIRALNISNYLVGALDGITAREMIKQKVHCFSMYMPTTNSSNGQKGVCST